MGCWKGGPAAWLVWGWCGAGMGCWKGVAAAWLLRGWCGVLEGRGCCVAAAWLVWGWCGVLEGRGCCVAAAWLVWGWCGVLEGRGCCVAGVGLVWGVGRVSSLLLLLLLPVPVPPQTSEPEAAHLLVQACGPPPPPSSTCRCSWHLLEATPRLEVLGVCCTEDAGSIDDVDLPLDGEAARAALRCAAAHPAVRRLCLEVGEGRGSVSPAAACALFDGTLAALRRKPALAVERGRGVLEGLLAPPELRPRRLPR